MLKRQLVHSASLAASCAEMAESDYRAPKADVNRVRRIAARQGLCLQKANDRVWWSSNYETYALFPIGGGPAVYGYGEEDDHGFPKKASLADVERWLADRVTPAPGPSKVLENNVRRRAASLGYKLERIRRRDPRAVDFGVYQLRDSSGSKMFTDAVTLDLIEERLAQHQHKAE